MVDAYPGTNSLLKRQVDLMEAYAEYLSFVPTAKHMSEFELDASRLHPTLLRDSIKAAAVAGAARGRSPNVQRRIVHQIYAKKTKEMAALWPLIFSVENAYRGALTEHYHTRFGRRDWWRVLDGHIIAGSQIPTTFCGCTISAAFARTLQRIMDSVVDNKEIYQSLRFPANENRFFHHLSLGQLIFFFESDWLGLSEIFVSGLVKGQVLSRTNIVRDLNTVRVVRNALYHSNPIRSTQSFIKAVEGLLLALDVNIARFDDDLRWSTYDRPIFGDAFSGRVPA